MSSSGVKLNFKKWLSKPESSSRQRINTTKSSSDNDHDKENQSHFYANVQHHSTPKTHHDSSDDSGGASDQATKGNSEKGSSKSDSLTPQQVAPTPKRRNNDSDKAESTKASDKTAMEKLKESLPAPVQEVDPKTAQHQDDDSDEAENIEASDKMAKEKAKDSLPAPVQKAPKTTQHRDDDSDEAENLTTSHQMTRENLKGSSPVSAPLTVQQYRSSPEEGDPDQNRELVVAKPRKVRIKRKTPQIRGILREIRRLQTSFNLLIPRLPFQRLVREILQSVRGNTDYRLQSAAIAALHESTEAKLIDLFEDAVVLAHHRVRETISVKDYSLAKRFHEKYESRLSH